MTGTKEKDTRLGFTNANRGIMSFFKVILYLRLISRQIHFVPA